jgi:hypothetical protein
VRRLRSSDSYTWFMPVKSTQLERGVEEEEEMMCEDG